MLRTLRLPPPVLIIAAPLGLLGMDIVVGHGGHAKLLAALAVATVAGVGVVVFLASWSRVARALVGVVLLIPNDGRYVVHAGLPFQLEPYRVVVGIFLVGWLLSLVVDGRVHARRTTFEGPLITIALAVFGSELANAARVITVSSIVIKALWLLMCMILAVYMLVSVIRTREALEKMIVWMVTAGAVVGFGAAVERETHYNLFNHFHTILPILAYSSLPGAGLVRDSHLRAIASAGHPIELGCTMCMLLPLAIYLVVTRKQRVWWLAVTLLLLGEFSTGSRTGILAILGAVLVFIFLRPREVLRAWPALIPIFALVHVADPGALGGIYAGFFPKGGLIAQQSTTFYGAQNTRLSRLGSSFHEFNEHNPFVGEGYGTRLTGSLTALGSSPEPASGGSAGAIQCLGGAPTDSAMGVPGCAQTLDDQWLKSLLEVGVVGVAGWLWLFGRAIRRLGALAKQDRESPDGWLAVALSAGIVAFAVSMLTYDAFSFIQATFLLFTFVALSSILLQLPSQRVSHGTSVADGGRIGSRRVGSLETRRKGRVRTDRQRGGGEVTVGLRRNAPGRIPPGLSPQT